MAKQQQQWNPPPLLWNPNPVGQSNIRCPHCGERGLTTTKQVNRKKGISGGKAVAAFFTGGFSMLAVGLSRKELETRMHCGYCGTTWYV
jgi:ribosomal protein S27AE